MKLSERLLEAKEKLGLHGRDLIVKDLQIEDWDEQKEEGVGICPFHQEKTPSFKWSTKDHAFKCFGCGKRYGIIDHFINFYHMTAQDSYQKLFTDTGIRFEFDDKTRKTIFEHYKYPQVETNTDRTKVEEYLSLRGISKTTLDFAEIKQDQYGNIVFEHKDETGKLLCTKYRVARKLKPKEEKMWWQKNTSNCPVLYNMNKVDMSKPLIIVEGHIDCLSVIEAGITNVVSIPHGANNFSWVDFNWEWLENFDEKIIVWSDDDDAGIKMTEEIAPKLGMYRTYIVQKDYQTKNDIKEYYKKLHKDEDKIDANNVLLACGIERIQYLINSAKPTEYKEVDDLMLVKDFDIQAAKKIPFPYASLNKLTFGAIEGSFTIISGETGSGKSTALIQMGVLASLEYGEKVFIYSGELLAPFLKNWVTLQLAGRRNIIEWDNGEFNPKGHTITNEAKEKMEQYYIGQIEFYKNYLETKPDDLINAMEYAYRRYNTKVFIIDNLMCVDFSEDANEYKAQTDFIRKLLRFTNKFHIYTYLVAHPKKPDGSNVTNPYRVSGSSNIVNLCHRLFWLQRTDPKDEEESCWDSKVIILKDRFLGKENEKILLKYDEASRRLYGSDDELYKKYKWGDDIEYRQTTYGKNGTLLSEYHESEVDEVL
jgi:twinkle protein